VIKTHVPSFLARRDFIWLFVNRKIVTELNVLLTNDTTRGAQFSEHSSVTSFMATVRTTEASGPQSSSDPEIQASRDGLDETTPLLRSNRALSSRSKTWRSAVSTFFDENAGLLLVAASQFFFTAMSTCVKSLNSLDDEPVPMLEVRFSSWSFSANDSV
jgi:hypothetical protein